MRRKQRITNIRKCKSIIMKVWITQVGRKEHHPSIDRTERKGRQIDWIDRCFGGIKYQAWRRTKITGK